jgi:hypothetical protein
VHRLSGLPLSFDPAAGCLLSAALGIYGRFFVKGSFVGLQARPPPTSKRLCGAGALYCRQRCLATAPVLCLPLEKRPYASKCVRTLGSSDSEATTDAAMSRSLTFRVLEAIVRIFMAVS